MTLSPLKKFSPKQDQVTTIRDCRGPSSTGRIFDVFAEYEEEFGKSPTTRDTQKPHPRFAAERHREPTAGGTAVTEGKGDKAGQSRDSLLQAHSE